MVSSAEFLAEMGTDPQKWADQFINTFRGEVVSDDGHNASVDVALMVTWFANAIGAGESRLAGRSMSHLGFMANETARAKGWWDKGREFDGVLMLIVSECSEALEEWRNNREVNETYFSIPDKRPDLTEFEDQNLRDRMYHLEGLTYRKNITPTQLAEDFSADEVDLLISKGYLKPEGIPSELADIIIRVFDAATEYGIDIEEQVIAKMSFNAAREHRHGGKRS